MSGFAFAPETRGRLRELFGGRSCSRCGQPAARLVAERFYCAEHFLLLRKARSEPKPVRVYRCSAER